MANFTVRNLAIFVFLIFDNRFAGADSLDACIFQNYGSAVARITYTPNGHSYDSQSGTGFIVTPSGHILTANHVLKPENEATVVNSEDIFVQIGGAKAPALPAKVLERDEQNDLAILKIESLVSSPLSVVPIDVKAKKSVGMILAGMGYPKADLTLVPSSFVTANDALIHNEIKSNWWQTSLALNAGDSGGPIFDETGNVVGVAEAIRNDGAQLVSFVIPLSSAQALLKKYGANGTSDRRCAGVANSRWGVVDKKNKCPDGYTIIDTSTIEGNGNGISIPDGAKICFVDVHVLNNKGYGFYVRAQGEMPPGKICKMLKRNGEEINYPIAMSKTARDCLRYAQAHYAPSVRLGCGGKFPVFASSAATSIELLDVANTFLFPQPNCGW